MLNDKLRKFHDLLVTAVAEVGMSPPRLTDAIMREAFPRTVAAAESEGADGMLRAGIKEYVQRYLKRDAPDDPKQLDLSSIDPAFQPIVRKLSSPFHYVESEQRYLHISELIARPDWLDDARKYKRRKGEETIAEAKILDILYKAVVGQRPK